MRSAQFKLYRYVRLARGWRYCATLSAANNKIRPDVVVIGGREEPVIDGAAYYLKIKGQWVKIGDTAADAQAEQKRRLEAYTYERAGQAYQRGTGEKPASADTPPGGTPLDVAVATYFRNLENRGADPKTLRAYRAAVEPFVAECRKATTADITKQDLLDHMGWLRKQPVPKRKHGNPERTYFNKISHIAIFLKAFGRSGLLKKSEYPQYEEKQVTAHTDEELEYLYSKAGPDQRFLLDFGLNIGLRDGEIAHAEYTDLSGNVWKVQRKPHLNWKPKKHHCRKITIPQWLTDAIRARGKSGLIFPNAEGKPNQHLLRDLQALVKDGRFHTELHKLRKTWATRLAYAGVPVHKLQVMLGHKSLVTTQRYLADVDLSKGELNRAIEAASFKPGPKLVKGRTL